MDGWYYKLFGDEFGPVTFDGLVELAKSQTLTSDDEVRFGETGPWRRAGSMGQLMTHMPSGAHIPSMPASVNSSAASSSASSSVVSKSDEPTGWYYQIFGEQFGPLTFEDLVELAKNHTLSVEDEVRFGENGAWRRAGSIGQLMAHLPFQSGKNAFSIELEQPTSESRKKGSDSQIELMDELEETEPLFNTSILQPAAVKTPSPAAPKRPSSPTPPPETQDVWWCMIAGKEYGPVDLPKLVAWAVSGRLHRTDYVRHGLESYVVANELAGLFPELPVGAAVAETKADFSARSATRSMAASNPVIATPISTPEPVPASDVPPSTPKPATSWQTNAGAGSASGGFNRPTVPIRRPPAKKSSGNLMDQLMMPLLGVVGVGVLGALIYFVLPLVMGGGDAKKFNELRAAYTQISFLRNGDNSKKEDFKAASTKLAEVAKKVESELKGKTGPGPVKLRALSKKLQTLAKEDLQKPADAEKDINTKMGELKKLLKLKD